MKNQFNIVNNRKGFTLTELIVTLAISAIVAGALAITGVSYMNWANYKRENDYAETLYSAAQMQITNYSERGQLAAISKVVDDDNLKIKISDLVGDDGQIQPTDVYGSNNDSISYFMGNSNDYKEYKSGTASDAVNALYDLLDPYVYDKSILNGAICIEFDADEGQIYSVIYSDKQSNFKYASQADVTGVVINDRSNDYRKPKMIGYYGVDTLSKSTTTKAQKPVISNVTLDNDNTLELSYKLSRVTEALTQMEYEMLIIDSDANKQILRLVFNDKNLKTDSNDTGNYMLVAKDAVSTTQTIEAKVQSGDDGNYDLGIYSFPAWIDNRGYVHFVLDAADINATEEKYKSQQLGGNDNIKNTFSFHRFGLDTQNIYCKIRGSGGSYKNTASKQSNTESIYYSKYQKNNNYTGICQIANARHLNNIRFDEASNIVNEYTLVNSLSWNKLEEDGDLFAPDEKFWDPTQKGSCSDTDLIASEPQAFVSISKLSTGAVFQSESASRIYTVSDLDIKSDENKNNGLSDAQTGFFIENNGTIKNISFDKITVTGTNRTGAVCGNNKGNLSNISILNSESKSSITGADYVGGVVGYQDMASTTSSEYKSLVNRAAVLGKNYVGGIIGRITAEGTSSFVVDSCKNYGQSSGEMYIGGITGSCEKIGNGASIKISNCTSSPQYSSEKISDAILEFEKTTDSKITGIYVGGIVGYNDSAELENCNTLSENGVSGYVIGKKFVGGIVGFNTGTAINGGDKNKNQANVLGVTYVGGIAGVSAEESDIKNADGTYEILETKTDSIIINNWINEGMVVSSGKFVGGITGLNTGKIIDSYSDVEYGQEARNLSNVCSLESDYAGGITGYNNGDIISSDPNKNIAVISVINGHNYVGGIVGYNDNDGVISNYEVQGGYIEGKTFVGGFAGLNSTVDLLERNERLSVNPNSVTGDYCVGGIIGGNIIAPTENISTIYDVDNFLGSVKADAFAGGFIGYNLLVSNRSEIEDISDEIIATFKASENDSAKYVKYAEYIDNKKLGLLASTKRSEYVLTVNGNNANMSGINADIFVGGVLGCNDSLSNLYVKGVTNYTPIVAAKAIEYPLRDNDKHKYSFAGGIIGYVSSHVIIENCRNANIGEVIAVGDYTGGISEVNNGIITDCTAQSPGRSTLSYIGGITGANFARGEIKFGSSDYTKIFEGKRFYNSATSNLKGGIYDCTLSGTVTGNNYVGGIASENYGVIYNPKVNGGVNGYGDNIGGVTGANYEDGSVILGSTLNVFINQGASSSNSNNVGGVAGTNYGLLNVEAGTEAAVSTIAEVNSGFAISGRENIGGIAGVWRSSQNAGGFVNYASILASNGNAGGIIGKIESIDTIEKYSISNCINLGTVQSTESGNAGGISAENSESTVIDNCIDYAQVIASNGIGGGITSINNGIISNSKTEKPNEEGFLDWLISIFSEKTLKMTGIETVGGISGINNGTMSNCSVSGLTLSNIEKSSNGAEIGGLTGRNTGIIEVSGNCVSKTSVSTYSNDSGVGGVAGINRATGIIRGISVSNAQIGSIDDIMEIGYASNAVTYSNFGGVAGANNGMISGITAYANINGDKGDDDHGYGGITGVNGGTVDGCRFAGSVTANGTANAIASLGGCVGINKNKAEISNSAVVGLSNSRATVIQNGDNNSAFAYTGGLVGHNIGSIIACDSSVLEYPVEVIGYAGHCGGIAAFNDTTGEITGTDADNVTATGAGWLVDAKFYSNDSGTGGIIGYSNSGTDVKFVNNYATVYNSSGQSSNTATGGFIGRFENQQNQNFKMSDCNNYGDVWSSAFAGGFIGRWKFYGGNLDNCNNYGAMGFNPSIYSKKDICNNSAGIVATFYMINQDQYINVSNSTNNGKIYGKLNSGGILGLVESNSFTIAVSDCVNTGVISGGSNHNGGIIANRSSSVKGAIYRCRNYGFAESGLAGKNKFGGISGSDSSLTTIDCVDYSNETGSPINRAIPGIFTDNYFVDRSSVADDYVKPTEAPTATPAPPEETKESSLGVSNAYVTIDNNPTGKIKISPALSKSYDKVHIESNDNRTGISTDAAKVVTYDQKNMKPGIVINVNYDLGEAFALDGFGINWCANGSVNANVYRQYAYKLFYSTDNGLSWKQVRTPDTADPNNVRNTYNSKLDMFVEVGDGQTADDRQIYYHEFEEKSAKVTNIKLSVYNIESKEKNVELLDAERASTEIWSTFIHREYVCIYDIYAVKAGETFDKKASYLTEYETGASPTATPKPMATPSPTINPNLTANGGYPLSVNKSGNALVDELGHLITITDLTDNPVSDEYYNDFSSWVDRGNSYRYKMIEQVDPKIQLYYQMKYAKAVPSAPKSLTINDVGGAYNLLWTVDKPAYMYHITYDIDGVLQEESFDATNTQQLVNIKDEWIGKTLTFYVRSAYFENNDNIYSIKYTDAVSASVTVLKPLPQPEVYYELTGTADDTYKLVLANKEDYVGYDLDNIKINTSGNGGSNDFMVLAGEKLGIKLGSGNGVTLSQAVPTAELSNIYGKSPKAGGQTKLISVADLKSTKYVATTFDGFYGTITSGLNYNIKLTGQGEITETYFATELLARDEELGVDVAISHGITHITRDYLLTSNLANIPDDMVSGSKNVTVRSYNWCGQNYMVYYGHTVAENLTADEVKARSDVISNGEVIKGYSIQKNTDGTYNIIYSTFLANDDVYYNQTVSTSYKFNIDDLSVTQTGATNKKIQPLPIIGEYSVETENSSGDKYTFTWDTDSTEENVNYNVTLMGITTNITIDENGDEKATDTSVEIISQQTNERTLTITDDNWRYNKILLKVERVGTVNENGQTQIFPAIESGELVLKLRLPTIERPQVTLHSGDDGIREKNDPIYDVSWTAIDDNYLSSLDYYEVTAYGVDSKLTGTFRTDGVVSIVDESGNIVNEYTDNSIASSNLATTLRMDLANFKESEIVQLSVRAIVKEDATQYRNGLEGVIREMQMPSRLAAPNLNNLEYKINNAIGVEAFKGDCVTINMHDTYNEKGTFEISAEIYDKEGDIEPSAYIYDNNGNQISENNPIKMNGNFISSSYSFSGISADNAGKYIRVAMRAVSDSQISSVWTDSVSAGVGVVQYRWIQLPKVQLDTVNLVEGTSTRIYGTANWDTINQTTLSFDNVEYAKDYFAVITHSSEAVDLTNDEDYRLSYVDYLYIRGTENGYKAYYSSSDPNAEVPKSGEKYNNAVYIGEFEKTGSSEIKLPYTYVVDKEFKEPVAQSYLAYNNGTFMITIPDFDGNSYYNLLHATTNVMVQTLATDSSNYSNSKLGCWYRTTNGDNNVTEFTTSQDYPQPSKVNAGEWAVSTFKGFNQQMQITSRYRLVLEISIDTDNNGNYDVIKRESLPGVASTSSVSSLWMLGDEYKQYGGCKAEVKYREIVQPEGITSEGSFETIIPTQN